LTKSWAGRRLAPCSRTVRQPVPSIRQAGIRNAAAVEAETVADEEEETDGSYLESSLSPNALEVQQLLVELCDDTSIAELKLKVGSFRLHVLRDVSGERAAQHAAHQASLLDIPTPPVPPQISMEEVLRGRQTTPAEAPKKEAPLEEDEVRPDEGLDFVVAPRVGLLRRGRARKGKQGRAVANEGQVVKEGQVICYVEQLGTQQPIESTVSGEIIQFLVDDGDAVGFGEPIVEVRPSFVGIKKLA
jgi:biotin carboxyl carrier protein